MLAYTQKEKYVASAQTFFQGFANGNDVLIEHIVTEYKT